MSAPLRPLDNMDYLLDAQCLTQEALEKADLALQKEMSVGALEGGPDILFFNRLLDHCAKEITAQLKREPTLEERIYIGRKVYAFLLTKGKV